MKSIPELLNKESLLAWARTKPADGVYSFFNQPRCVIADYLNDNGHPQVIVDTYSVTERGGERGFYRLPPGWNKAALGKETQGGLNGVDPERTYGAFIKRIEELA